MVHAVRMPKPGQMTEECTVIAWHKKEGDPVRRGDVLFEIETDKSTIEYESPDAGRLARIVRHGQRDRRLLLPVQILDDAPGDGQRVGVVFGQMIDDAGNARMHVGTAEVFGRDDFTRGGFHQRRTAQKDRALVLDDDGLVAHGRHVGAAGRA